MTDKGFFARNGRQLLIEFLLGIFFVIAMIICFYFTAIVNGKDLFFGKQQYMLRVKFPSVGALSVSDKVCVRGMAIGRVDAFSFGEKFENVVVALALSKEIPIYKDYSVEIRNSSVFGGQYVLINPGDSKSGLSNNSDLLVGKEPYDIINDASELISALQEDEKRFRKLVLESEIIANVDTTAQELRKGAKEFNEMMTALQSGKGTLGKLLNDPSMYDEASKTFKNVNLAASKFDKVNQAIENINEVALKMRHGNGTLGKLLNDDKAYNDLIASLQKLHKFTSEISSNKGSLGKIIGDGGKLYDAIRESFNMGKKLMSRLQDGEGTLGLLLTDDTLYLETKETVKQLRAAVEDWREQAPVATFLGAL